MVDCQDPSQDDGGSSWFVDFVRGFAFGGPLPRDPAPKTSVGIADLRVYLRTKGYPSLSANRAWMIFLTQVLPALAKDPINLEVAAKYATNTGNIGDMQLEIADLKAIAEHLQPGMVQGYISNLHDVLCAWIASL